jgi:hypothetical protein
MWDAAHKCLDRLLILRLKINRNVDCKTQTENTRLVIWFEHLYIRIQTLCFWFAPTWPKNGLSKQHRPPNVCDQNTRTTIFVSKISKFGNLQYTMSPISSRMFVHSDLKGLFFACGDLVKNTRFESECTNFITKTQTKTHKTQTRAIDFPIWNLHSNHHIYFKGRFLAKSAKAKNTSFESECTNVRLEIGTLCIADFQIWKSTTQKQRSLVFWSHTFERQCCFERPFFGQVGSSQKHKV